MYVFSLLGIVLDGLMANALEVLADDETAEILIDDTRIIDRFIMPLCDEDVAEVTEKGDWYSATLVFGKNRRGEGEIQIVRFENSLGDEAECEVGDAIITELVTNYLLLDKLYHHICDEIMF